MTNVYDTLQISLGKCPTDCSACEEACATEKGTARIRAVRVTRAGFHGAVTCLQCGDPACSQVCPTGAIAKSKEDGIVRIKEEKCAGCGLCTVVCPYGGIYYEYNSRKPIKCDQCGGQPKCVEACKHGVLSFIQPRRVHSYLAYTGLMPEGTGQCLGCCAELGLRFALRILGSDIILFGAASCAAGVISHCRVPIHICLMTNIAPTMEGVRQYYRKMGRDVKLVAYAGDGATADVGFQSLSGAAERGENLIYICYDNEGYMNTGIQRSGTTPRGAWTNTTPLGERRRGKEQAAKYMPLIMADHGIPYVATATLSHLEDYARKLTKAAEVKNGMAYIHLLAPCPTGWRAPTEAAIDICRMAVETNYFPLWETADGKLALTYEVKDPKPIAEFTRLMGRFSHFTSEDIIRLQRTVDDRFASIKNLARP